MNKTVERMKYLEAIINQANYDYHTLDEPTIDDRTYDLYLKELIELEANYPLYKSKNSPTSKVGGVVLDKFNKIIHDKPMMSLGNAFSKDDLIDFSNKIAKAGFDCEYTTELKIDGLAVNIKYENGIYKSASTRGDGLVGEDVTENVRTIKSLPNVLKKPLSLEVRGEIYMPYKSFIKTNEERYLNEEELFKNPRNAAAGTIRQLDSNVVSKRELDAFIYTLVDPEKYDVKTQSDVLSFLSFLGFKVNEHFHVSKEMTDVTSLIDTYDALRHKLPYDTDGVVIKVNQVSLYEDIGYTAKFPKWAIAYKFAPEEVQTTLTAITYQVGRTGVITPVAELEPVMISGSLVSRATLHNEDYIKSLDIELNDIVVVRKAGEIIPEVVRPVIEKRTNTTIIEMIEVCPSCDSKLVRLENEADWYCLNPVCPAQQVGKIVHFASRVAMNIDTLGEKVIAQLYEIGLLRDIKDIYTLKDHQEKLLELDRMGTKKIENLLNAIEDSKTNSLDKLLFGLGIRHVGQKVSKTLVKHYPSLRLLSAAKYEDLIEINEIGDRIASSIVSYFSIPYASILVDHLEANGLNLQSEQKTINTLHVFSNQTFVLTGKLETLSREEATQIIEGFGGKVSGSVSKKTNYLLAGSDSGSKLDKANSLGIKVLDERTFREMSNNE